MAARRYLFFPENFLGIGHAGQYRQIPDVGILLVHPSGLRLGHRPGPFAQGYLRARIELRDREPAPAAAAGHDTRGLLRSRRDRIRHALFRPAPDVDLASGPSVMV